MRYLLLFLFLAATAVAQRVPRTLILPTTESLRGVSAVSEQIIWASGTHGTYLRTTDAGHIWQPAQVPGATTLDFRAVVAFSAAEAFLMSAGPGGQSRIYHTADAGLHWSLQFTNTNPKGFFDSMVFWDATHGVVLGDPIPGEAGKLKFELLQTEDGQTWHNISAQLPPAQTGEGAFAASNTSLVILRNSVSSTSDEISSRSTDSAPWKSGASAPRKPAEKEGASALDPNLWFATGGSVARVFHSPDRGQTWQVADTPIIHGPDSAGIFSIAFRDPLHGVIAGGDYKNPQQDGPNLAFTSDGGKTWTLSTLKPQVYFSAVAYDRQQNSPNSRQNKADARRNDTHNDNDNEKDNQSPRLFLVNPDFLFDSHPPGNPRRIDPPKNAGIHFNAASPYPSGGAVFVGPKGSMLSIP